MPSASSVGCGELRLESPGAALLEDHCSTFFGFFFARLRQASCQQTEQQVRYHCAFVGWGSQSIGLYFAAFCQREYA
jgi:hypothetical protein